MKSIIFWDMTPCSPSSQKMILFITTAVETSNPTIYNVMLYFSILLHYHKSSLFDVTSSYYATTFY
jgi:hypothetical protein